jgi:hypothetical protein
MPEVLAWLQRLVTTVTDTRAILAWLRGILAAGGAPIAEGSLMEEWFTTYNVVQSSSQMLNSGTYGLSALAALIAQARLDLLAAIAALPAGSDIVIPPAADNAEAVWIYQGDFRDQTGNMLSKLDETNTKIGPTAGYLAPATPWFALYDPTSFID